MCGGGGCDRSGRNGFLLCVLLRVVVPVCIDLCVFWFCSCRSHCNDCVKVAWCRGCMRNIIFLQMANLKDFGVAAWRLRLRFVSRFFNFGAGDFPCKIPFKKCFKIVFFFCFGAEVHPVLGLQFVLLLCIRKFLCVILFSVRICCV